MTDYYVKGTSGIIRAPAGGGSVGGGVILTGVVASTLVGFSTQTIPNDGNYHGIFHDRMTYLNGASFDGYNVAPDSSHHGWWHYGANGKIVGTPSSGTMRVVIAGVTDDGLYSGEVARFVYTPAMFAAGYVGYNVFAQAFLGNSDGLGAYIVNNFDVSLTIEQGDPDDGSGPPACQIEAYLLTFASSPGS